MGVVIDTCIWVDVERGALSPADIQDMIGKEPVFMSPVTIAELTFGAQVAAREDIRQRRVAALQRLKKKPALFIDEETGTIFGHLSAALKKQGRGSDHRIQDLWIASQAVQHGFPVLTRNAKDFQDIPGLEVISIP